MIVSRFYLYLYKFITQGISVRYYGLEFTFLEIVLYC